MKQKTQNIKKILVLSLSFLLFIALSSCGRVKGVWEDNIHLARKSVTFNARGDSIIISTLGSWWWITDIGMDSTYYYHFKNIDQSKDYYSIKENGIVVGRRGRRGLFIKAGANPHHVQRIISVGLEAGDYFDRVIITQLGK